MELAVLDEIALEYEVSGEGEPVAFIHGSFIADAFRPLLTELDLPGLASSHRLVSYHRRGYAYSGRSEDLVSIEQQAADCRALLHHLGIERAHVVGHSFGGAVALQLALDAPDLVQTLALFEPALAFGAGEQAYRDSLAGAIQRFREAGAAVVVDEFMEARWPGYRAPLEKALPGAIDQAVDNAAFAFESELPGLLVWHFGEEEARRIDNPVLSLLGGESDALWPRFGETHRALLDWMKAEEVILPGTTHFGQVENPHDMAEGLAAFWERHQFET